MMLNVISDTGIWNGGKKETHKFMLSPDVFKITNAQKKELSNLGSAINDCLKGLSHIAVISYDEKLNYRRGWRLFRNIFSTGVPKFCCKTQGINFKDIPKLIKINVMIDQQGNFKIAEIDAHNKHGLGYSTLGMLLREASHPKAIKLPGVIKLLSQEIKKTGNKISFQYDEKERFYIPEFEIAKKEFQKNGIDCDLFLNHKIDPYSDSELFMDMPLSFVPNTLIDRYEKGTVKFIIPPKPFMGSKGVLALLCNAQKYENIENILRAFIKKGSLELVRNYIPETLLVNEKTIDYIKKQILNEKFVLKEFVSSGMKGITFSSDEEIFKEKLNKISCKKKSNFILQKEIVSKAHKFSFYKDIYSDTLSESMFFTRLTIHYVNRDLADIVVTARQDKEVHGKDCLILGTEII